MLRTSFGRIRPGHPTTSYPGVAQLVARLLWEQDAAGSNPVTPTITSVLTGFEYPVRALVFLCSFCQFNWQQPASDRMSQRLLSGSSS